MDRLKILFVGWILVAAMGSGCSFASEEERPEGSSRTNILVAIADDWGWPHAGAYGDPVVRTPVFDRLAEDGILFEHAYVSSPSCTSSRAALLTGQWHWRLEESANLWSTLQAKFPVYPDLLENAGYHIGYQGKGWGPGKVEVGGRSRNPAGPQFESLSDFLDQQPPDAPFCYWFGSTDPHRPYEEGSGKADGIDLDQIPVPVHFPDSPEVRGDIADYYQEVQRFDSEVGGLLAEIERRGLLDNTLVVITGDNGMPFPRAKATLYDAGVRVPLVVYWTGAAQSGRRFDGFVSLTDLAPTFLELAGLEVPQEMTGNSLANILKGQESGNKRDFVLTGKERHVPAQETPDMGGTPMRAIRTHEFLYIRNYRPDRWPAGTPDPERAVVKGSWYGDIDNGPTKFFMFAHREEPLIRLLFERAFGKRPAEELYDLRNDPQQTVNVATEPEYREIRASLSGKLESLLRSSADPRAEGKGDLLESYPYYGGSPLHPDYGEPGQ